MKYTAAVFPFSEQALPIVRHMDDFDVPYIVDRLIGFKGDGLDKKDAAYICNQPPIGLTVTDCFASVGENWQVLIRLLAKLGKAVNIADASNQRKAKSETASAVAVSFREDTKPFDKADSVFHKDTFL